VISQAKFAEYAADPSAFREALTIDADGVARRFGDVIEPWQRSDFAAIDPALMRCNGRALSPNHDSSSDAKMRAYLERSRGHSKTTDIAITCVWALVFATRPIRGYAFAADQDQAKLLKDAVETIIRLNPWIGEVLEVQRDSVVNIATRHPGQGAKLEIWTSDVGSSYGISPDLLVCDELCHWQGDGSLWHSLISSAAKRANCLLLCISNAGFADSWQWGIREAARTDDAWVFSRLDGPQASWLTPARLAEQRRMLPAIAYARLWLNQWSAAGGDALTPADIHAAFDERLQPMRGHDRMGFHDARPVWQFVAGVDLGLTRDCSAVVVLAIPTLGQSKTARIRLAHHKMWKPSPGEKVNIADIEKHILTLDQEYDLEAVAYDVWQAEHLAQRLEVLSMNRRRTSRSVTKHNKPWMREIAPTGSNLREQATLVIEGFQDRRFHLYPCEPLKRDLLKLRVEEKSYGMRLTSPRDGDGHGDTFSAFALALLIGHELSTTRPAVAGSTSSGDPYGRPMSALERELAASAERHAMLNEHARHVAMGMSEDQRQFMRAVWNDRQAMGGFSRSDLRKRFGG